MAENLTRITDKHLNRIMFWVLAIGGTGAIFLVSVVPLVADNQEISTRIERLQERSELLRNRVAELQREHYAALHDPFYIELVARTELYLLKPGEEVLRVSKTSSSPLAARRQDPGRDLELAGRLAGTVQLSPGYRWTGFVLGVLSLVAALCLFGPEAHEKASSKTSAGKGRVRTTGKGLRGYTAGLR